MCSRSAKISQPAVRHTCTGTSVPRHSRQSGPLRGQHPTWDKNGTSKGCHREGSRKQLSERRGCLLWPSLAKAAQERHSPFRHLSLLPPSTPQANSAFPTSPTLGSCSPLYGQGLPKAEQCFR